MTRTETIILTNKMTRRVKTQGEPIELHIRRLTMTKEPLSDPTKTAPLIYTERKEGVRASTNIRTDRFEIAVEAMDTVTKTRGAKREERVKLENRAKGETDKSGDTPPDGGTK